MNSLIFHYFSTSRVRLVTGFQICTLLVGCASAGNESTSSQAATGSGITTANPVNSDETPVTMSGYVDTSATVQAK